MSDEPDRDLLAAEFVLGSLEGAERGEAERTGPVLDRA